MTKKNKTNSIELSIKVDIMHYPVFAGSLSEITLTDSLKVFQTINAYSYVLAERTPDFKLALQNADYLIPDGFPVVIASKLLKNQEIHKIAGADLFLFFMEKMNKEHGRVFFLGSTELTLSRIVEKVKNQYPNITIGVFSPLYKELFSEEDSLEMVLQINHFKPDVVFVGMTAPKQEVWVEMNKHKIKAKAICSIGAVFDFYAGNVKRAPKFMISLNLEWFYRLIREPRRLWKRYVVYSPIFFIHLFLYLIRIKKLH